MSVLTEILCNAPIYTRKEYILVMLKQINRSRDIFKYKNICNTSFSRTLQ